MSVKSLWLNRQFLPLWLFLLTLTSTLPKTALADRFGPNWFLPLLFGEVYVGNTDDIKDQGNYPYCTLYAMSSYLETWAQEKNGGDGEPLSVTFLSVGYNLEYGNAATGTHNDWLVYALKKYGIIPASAWKSLPAGLQSKYFPKGWQETHRELIPPEHAEKILGYKYSDGHNEFSGKDYFHYEVALELTKMEFRESLYREKLKPSKDQTTVKHLHRIEDYTKRNEHRKKVFEAEGLPTLFPKAKAEDIVQSIAKELNNRKPVLLNLNTNLVNGDFENFSVIAQSQLHKEGEGTMGNHTMVAVGECDTFQSKIDLCQGFVERMKTLKVEKCIILQNSWGSDSHQKGYACVEDKALRRMLWDAFLPKEEGL